ncbi:hypothetical protein BC628DRAFT_1363520, partial [Trametes gibbosa]
MTKDSLDPVAQTRRRPVHLCRSPRTMEIRPLSQTGFPIECTTSYTAMLSGMLAGYRRVIPSRLEPWTRAGDDEDASLEGETRNGGTNKLSIHTRHAWARRAAFVVFPRKASRRLKRYPTRRMHGNRSPQVLLATAQQGSTAAHSASTVIDVGSPARDVQQT